MRTAVSSPAQAQEEEASTSGGLATYGQAAVDGVHVNASVIRAYAAAREHGAARSEAFLRAVGLYRTHRPDLAADRAGTEVARILLAAAREQMTAGLSSANALSGTDDLEYADPT